MHAKDTTKSTPKVNTHPNCLIKMPKDWGSIYIWCRAAIRNEDDDGWVCHGVTYSNCEETPDWHEEPLELEDAEVEVCLRLRHGGKNEIQKD